jgi:hypothetical protein
LSGTSTRPDVTISPFWAASKLERDHKARALMPVSDHELGAYESLFAFAAQQGSGMTVKVTGRLHKHGENEFSLDAREFSVANDSMNA